MEAERELLCRAALDLFAAGQLTAFGGNLSLRVGGDYLITPSGRFKGALTPRDLLLVGGAAQPVPGASRQPSTEWPVHLALYQACPGVQAVVHTHPPYATALYLTGGQVLPLTDEAAFLADTPLVPYHRPGSPELAAAVVEAMAGKSAAVVVLQNHGAIAAGPDLEEAVALARCLEDVARLTYLVTLTRREAPLLKRAAYLKARAPGPG
ncbi:MAG: class II aldolase/adducin family protein [Bacillota bacterium]